MKQLCWWQLVTLAVLVPLFAAPSHAKSEKKQLKDVQLKIPLQIRARRDCTGADCVKTCPMDYDLDSKKQYCRYKRAICPSNYVLRHGSCVLREIQCPPGSIRQGNRCVVKSLECPSGYVLEGNSCVNAKYCPTGYHWENGFCYQQRRPQVCPHGYDNRNGVCIQICVNCEAACADCEEERVPLQCPNGYEQHRGRCLKISQGRADVVLRNITYKVPAECRSDETYRDGTCVSWVFDDPRCPVGHIYNGRCVEVARCSRGLLQSNCECLLESTTQATCLQGQQSPAGCIVGKAQCKKPALLTNDACVRMTISAHMPFCTRGTPYGEIFCEIGRASCPAGFTLDGTYCKKSHTMNADCGKFTYRDGWCISDGNCGPGYTRDDNGVCVLVRKRPDSDYSEAPVICATDYYYDDHCGMCIKCITTDQNICDAGYILEGDECVKYEPLCPVDYVWTGEYCYRKPYMECSKGHFSSNYCMHSHLSCPPNYAFWKDVCLRQESDLCSDGTSYQNGLCVSPHTCPEGYSFGRDCCVQETQTPLNGSLTPSCSPGYFYDNGNCVRTIWKNATINTRPQDCPTGYKLINGTCTIEYYGQLVCPPRTILMNLENRCFCKVDLVCPTGYERLGDECIFRYTNYISSFINFLNPCYGVQCGLQHCITQCFSPPCPVQPCSFGSYQPPNALQFNSFNHPAISEPCGIGETCHLNEQHESIIGLICPPGYSRENNTCVAYYDRICQSGFKMSSGRCVKIIEVDGLCPLGFVRSFQACIRVRCDSGYTLEGTKCKKVDCRAPNPCPKSHVLINGFCIHKSECIGGSIEGGLCIKRSYDPYSCRPGLLHYNDSCIEQNRSFNMSAIFELDCPSGTIRVNNLCVHQIAAVCTNEDMQSTKCTGIIRQNQCAYVKNPWCQAGSVFKDGTCRSCSSKPPACPPGMVIINGRCIKQVQPPAVPSSVKPTTCIEGATPAGEGKCVHRLPSCRPGYVLRGNICSRTEVTVASCSSGMIVDDRCVELVQCSNPNFTVINGTCVSIECSEPTCSSKSKRTKDVCINGQPKCPDNYCFQNGHCYSTTLKPAECSGSGQCAESFCHLSHPSCSSSFSFDGSVCKKAIASSSTCPPGTQPDPTDRNYCLYSSEQADFICASQYHYRNGICQKRQYTNATCPNGFRRKADVCWRRSCSNSALTNYCGISVGAQSDTRIGLPLSQNHSPPISVPEHNGPCCVIFSPRICRQNDRSSEWSCSHTKHNRCGAFCEDQGQHIYLRTATSYNVDGVLILVPPDDDFENNDHSGEEEEDYVDESGRDCESCTDRSYDCSSYCYTFDCQRDGGNCLFLEQEDFCRQYPGPGCSAEDGCVDKEFCVD